MFKIFFKGFFLGINSMFGIHDSDNKDVNKKIQVNINENIKKINELSEKIRNDINNDKKILNEIIIKLDEIIETENKKDSSKRK